MNSDKQPGAKTTGQRQQTLKAKRKAEGLVRVELWVKSSNKNAIKEMAALLDK